MRHLEAVLVYLLTFIRRYLPEACYTAAPEQMELFDQAPLFVRYHNGETEWLQLEADVKIDRDGVVYFKERAKNKWVAYPEIAEITFNTDGLRG